MSAPAVHAFARRNSAGTTYSATVAEMQGRGRTYRSSSSRSHATNQSGFAPAVGIGLAVGADVRASLTLLSDLHAADGGIPDASFVPKSEFEVAGLGDRQIQGIRLALSSPGCMIWSQKGSPSEDVTTKIAPAAANPERATACRPLRRACGVVMGDP